MFRICVVLIALVVAGFYLGSTTSAKAGSMPDEYCNVCKMFKRGLAPEPPPPAVEVVPAPSDSGTVCFWALNRKPTPMVLHNGPGPASNKSRGLVSWHEDRSAWTPSPHYPGFVTRQICFPAAVLRGRDVVSLCGDVGYQDFRRDDGVIDQIIAAGSSPQSDPACIAGSQCPPHLR